MTWPDDHYKAHPYFLMGVKHEHDRIIELLEHFKIDPHTPEEGCETCDLIRHIILLVKGEVQ